MAWTVGWVWVFDLIDHHSAEAWAHVAKVGDRFAALQPVYCEHSGSTPVGGGSRREVMRVRMEIQNLTAPDRLAAALTGLG
jgi:hypothetical protein